MKLSIFNIHIWCVVLWWKQGKKYEKSKKSKRDGKTRQTLLEGGHRHMHESSYELIGQIVREKDDWKVKQKYKIERREEKNIKKKEARKM